LGFGMPFILATIGAPRRLSAPKEPHSQFLEQTCVLAGSTAHRPRKRRSAIRK
jgi:hypothetical protein